jgi:hypothetical protein
VKIGLRERERGKCEETEIWRKYERQGTEKGRKLKMGEMEITEKMKKQLQEESGRTHIGRKKASEDWDVWSKIQRTEEKRKRY